MVSAALTGVLAVGLAAVHVFGERLRFLQIVPRSVYLSAAGGVSVGYVFVHVLPELARRSEAARPLFGVDGPHVYTIALAGFVAFYGLEQFARRSTTGDAALRETSPSAGVFWVHVVSFAVFNAVIGYLLVHRDEPGLASLGFFAVAVALHFVVNDHGLREHHRDRYHDVGRWVLAVGVVAGWSIALATAVPEAIVDVLFAFLAGGIVLNAIKEELPEDRQSRFWAFAAGSVGYAALLLAV